MKSPEMPQTFGLGINANHPQDHQRVNDDSKILILEMINQLC